MFWSSCHCRGPPGDLFVYLEVEEIPGIQRDGINLSSTLTISYLDAILGVVVKVNGFWSVCMAFYCICFSSNTRYHVFTSGIVVIYLSLDVMNDCPTGKYS